MVVCLCDLFMVAYVCVHVSVDINTATEASTNIQHTCTYLFMIRHMHTTPTDNIVVFRGIFSIFI